MSGGPQPASYEDWDENDHTPIPGTYQSANIKAKRSKPDLFTHVDTIARDAASDSGYSSQTIATVSSAGSTQPRSIGSIVGLESSRTASRSSSSRTMQAAVERSRGDHASPTKPTTPRTVSRTQRRENLRSLDPIESREGAARMKLTSTPVGESARMPARTRSQYSGPPSPQAVRSHRPSEDTGLPVRLRPSLSQGESASRRASYHAGLPRDYIQLPPHTVVMGRAAPPPLQLNTSFVASSFPPPPPSAVYIPTPLPTSPQRHSAYPFPPSYPGTPYSYEQYHGSSAGTWQMDPWARSRRSSVHMGSPMEYVGVFQPPSTGPLHQPPPRMHHRRDSIHRMERPQPMIAPKESRRHDVDEDFYSMPPPPVPQPRPHVSRAATTTLAHPLTSSRRAQRQSVDLTYGAVAHSPSPQRPSLEQRKNSVDESRPPSRPKLKQRRSIPPKSTTPYQANVVVGFGGEGRVSSERPRQPTPIQRAFDVDTREAEREREAEAYQRRKSGGSGLTAMTLADIEHEALQRPTTSSHRSSRDGSDVKRAKASSRNSGEKLVSPGDKAKKDDQNFTLRFKTSHGSTRIGFKGDAMDGKTISVRSDRYRDGQMEIMVGDRSSARSRPRQLRDSSTKRYSYAGNDRVVQEIDHQEHSQRTRSRSRSVAARYPLTARAPARDLPREPAMNDERGEREGGLLDRFQRMNLRTQSLSRADQRGRMPAEGRYF